MDINEPLQHYASPYYDPVKAHEYYTNPEEGPIMGRPCTGMVYYIGSPPSRR